MLPDLFNYSSIEPGMKNCSRFVKHYLRKSLVKQAALSFRSGIGKILMFGIARNVFKEYLREHRNNTSRLVPMDPENSQSDHFDRNKLDTRILLKHLIAMLPEKEQELVALRYGAGLNNREIAKLLHLSESNVGTRLFRIVQSLRKKMEVDNE